MQCLNCYKLLQPIELSSESTVSLLASFAEHLCRVEYSQIYRSDVRAIAAARPLRSSFRNLMIMPAAVITQSDNLLAGPPTKPDCENMKGGAI